MSARASRVERYAWPTLGACVLAIDLYLIRTEGRSLSTQFAESCRHPSRKWLTLASWAYISAHLIDVWPDRFDPLSRLAVLLAKRGEPCGIRG